MGLKWRITINFNSLIPHPYLKHNCDLTELNMFCKLDVDFDIRSIIAKDP